MPRYTVYFIGLSNAATRTVNQLGWDKAPGGTAYLDATCFPKAPAIEAAVRAGLYDKAATVEASGEEHVWTVMQNFDAPWTANPQIIEVHTLRPRSMMVGDIIHDEAAGTWAFCASFGFEPLATPPAL